LRQNEPAVKLSVNWRFTLTKLEFVVEAPELILILATAGEVLSIVNGLLEVTCF
jgi:hypothetical protein